MRPSGGKANLRVTTTPITGSNTDLANNHRLLRTESRKGRACDDIPSVIIKSTVIARMLRSRIIFIEYAGFSVRW